MKMQALFA